MAGRPNRFPGICTRCKQQVPAGAGLLGEKGADGKYPVTHITCPTVGYVSTKPKLIPTAEQEAIIAAFLTGEDLVIEAGAGAAKSSSLVMCAEADPGRGALARYHRGPPRARRREWR